MLDLRSRLEIQDLMRILGESKLKYGLTMNKCSRNGEITYLEIRIAKEDDEE